MDYKEYSEMFPESVCIPENEFPFYMAKAKSVVKLYTFGRSDECDFPEVKYAQAELCRFYYENKGRFGIKSEANDGLSVSYAENTVSEEKAIIKRWLGETGLMYSGAEKG